MSSQKLDEVAAEIDDASDTVEELQDDPGMDTDEKLEELHKTLEHAADSLDALDNKAGICHDHARAKKDVLPR